MLAHWFWLNEVIPKTQKYLADNVNNQTATKHLLGKHTLPDKWADFDYYDKKFIEDYYCSRMKSDVKEKLFFDTVGQETYNEIKIFKFDC